MSGAKVLSILRMTLSQYQVREYVVHCDKREGYCLTGEASYSTIGNDKTQYKRIST